MKIKIRRFPVLAFAILAILSTLNYQLSTARAQGTAFTYQGRLNNGANAANGIYDLRFAIYDSTNNPGTLIVGPVTNAAVTVSNGLFTTTLDFGAGIFTSANRWLDIAVRTNGATPFATLAPRQPITPTPYAIYAGNAGTAISAAAAGSVPAAGIGTGTASINITGNAVTATSAAYAGSAAMAYTATTATTATTAANVTGNIADAQLSANITRLNGTNNFTGTNTFANVVAATNVNNVIAGTFTGNGGGLTNLNTAQFANSVLTNGQTGNVTINGSLTLPPAATVADILNSGSSTLMLADNNDNFFAGVGAGNLTMSGGFNVGVGYSALKVNAGGNFNTANGAGALLNNTSGNDNTAIGFNSMGLSYSGNNNTVCGAYALANNLSGSNNIALGYLAGTGITGNFNIDIGNSGVGTDNNIIRIGSGQTQTFIAGVINGNGGGLTNLNASQLAGGTIPLAQLPAAVATNDPSGNVTLNGNLFLPATTASAGTIYAGGTELIQSFGVQNIFAGSAAGNWTMSGYDDVGVGYAALYNNTTGWSDTGIGANALQNNTTGFANTACGASALTKNMTGVWNTAVGTGALAVNTAGNDNTAIGEQALYYNNGSYNTAIGVVALKYNTNGNNNIALGYQAGYNISTGSSNIDIGNLGLATDTNIIRIGSGQTSTFIAGSMQMSGNAVMNDNDIQFRNDSYHGVGWYGGGKLFGGVNVNGPVLYGGSGGGLGCTGNGNNLALAWTSSGVTVNGTFNNNSDRNAKQNFASVKPEEVLAKLAQLPVMQWSYKTDAETRHIGPMAQDFYAAFAVGTDERHIAPIDEGGVALAAIQGLNHKLEQKETEITELKARLERLEQFMNANIGGGK